MSPAKDAGVSEGTTTEPNDLLLASIPLTQATEAEYGEWVSGQSMSESLPLSNTAVCQVSRRYDLVPITHARTFSSSSSFSDTSRK